VNHISRTEGAACGLDDMAPALSFHDRCLRQRIPVGGSFDLTHRCNLRCRHCYLGDQIAIRRHRGEELTTGEILDILDQAAAAGTLFLTLTGGDPMIRPDFPEIYRHAVRKGMLVTVFANGTLVNETIIDLFRDLPPRQVEVSVYGATAATYEKITQVPGSFGRFIAGLDLLRGGGVRFRLKSVLMTLNRHELAGMEAMAEHYGVKFHYDTAIFPCMPYADNEGGSNLSSGRKWRQGPESLRDPLTFRIPAAEIAALDVATAERRRHWLGVYQHEKGKKLANRLYSCGAGIASFHIDPYGFLQPCVMTWSLRHDLRQGSFLQGWNGIIASLHRREAGDGYHCNRCAGRPVCLGCPSLFLLETGSERIVSEYICETAKARLDKIKQMERQAIAWPGQPGPEIVAPAND